MARMFLLLTAMFSFCITLSASAVSEISAPEHTERYLVQAVSVNAARRCVMRVGPGGRSGRRRRDDNGDPCVIPTSSLYVTAGTARRQTGTQYTPRTLTESVVEHALAPLVYIGPAEGQPPEAWSLQPAARILDLKICDFACGSAASAALAS